jgi:hypothetical protein
MSIDTLKCLKFVWGIKVFNELKLIFNYETQPTY